MLAFSNNTEPNVQQNKAREKALSLLTRREYTRYQLVQKLQAFKGDVDIQALLDDLVDLGLQSDYRYTDILVRSKANGGYGLKRIAQWAYNNGIDNELLHDVAAEQQIDWFDVALQQKRKYFGLVVAKDAMVRAKQMKYLYQRGFSNEQINFAVDCEKCDQ